MDKNAIQMLYVDDEQDNLTVFSSRFRKMFKVHTATSAADGLNVLEHNPIQIVISDHRMPEMTGVQFLHQVREKYPEAIRIILTAFTDSDDIIDAINKGGVYSFVRKPWSGDELTMLIEKALTFYSLRQRNKGLIQRLYTSINELEMFYYRISHELRGPLATQLGILNLAKDDAEPEHAVQYIDMLKGSIEKLEQTVRRIESTHLPTEKGQLADFDFQSVIDKILEGLKPEINGRGIGFLINVEPGIQYKSYPKLVNTLLENLIENGIFFSDPGKPSRTISINVAKAADHVSVVVEDNGLGIEETQLANVFHPFYRGHAISKGTGLGLYIVKKTIDYLGGSIAVTSKELEGTCIRINLPFLIPEEAIESVALA